MMYGLQTAVAAGALLFFGPLAERYDNKCTPDSTGHCTAALGPTYDTGQTRYVENLQVADLNIHYSQGQALQIVDNKLTNTTTDAKGGAGFTQANIGKPVSSIGGTFVLQPAGLPGTGGVTGSAAFVVASGLLSYIAPEGAFHLAISRVGWALRVYMNDPQPFSSVGVTGQDIALVQFANPLINDGKTVYSFTATFSTTTAGTPVVTMDLHELNSPGLQLMSPATVDLNPNVPIGNFPFWETYQGDASSGSTGDDKAAFISIFAN